VESTSFRKWKYLFIGVLLVGVIIRIGVFDVPGTHDVDYFRGWSRGTWDLGIQKAYPPYPCKIRRLTEEYNLPITYPPGTAYYLSVMGGIFQVLPRRLQTTEVLTGFVKLPTCLFELLGALALYFYVGKRRGERQKTLVFTAYWLNPAVILAGPILGYQDGVATSLVCISLLFALDSLVIPAAVLFVAALLVKQLALFAFPVLFVFFVRSAKRPQGLIAIAAMPLTAAFILAPYLISGRIVDIFSFLRSVSIHHGLSLNALNSWWIVSSFIQARDQMVAGIPFVRQIFDIKLGYMDAQTDVYHLIARVCYVGFTLVNLLFLFWRSHSRNAYVFATAMQYYGYFMLMTGVHENHLIFILPFAALLIFESKELRYLFYGLSFMVFINLYWFYGLTGAGEPRGFKLFSFLTVVFSVANFSIFVLACIMMLRGIRMQGNADDLLPRVKSLLWFSR
jgi:hypothetical protein